MQKGQLSPLFLAKASKVKEQVEKAVDKVKEWWGNLARPPMTPVPVPVRPRQPRRRPNRHGGRHYAHSLDF